MRWRCSSFNVSVFLSAIIVLGYIFLGGLTSGRGTVVSSSFAMQLIT
ncbi:MAG: hypothetical protein ABI286_03080 [Edaphobacter sp.]